MGKKVKKIKLISALIEDNNVKNQESKAPGIVNEIANLKEYYKQKGFSLVFSSSEELNRDMIEAVANVAVDLWKLDQRLKAQENKIETAVYQTLHRPLESAIQKMKQKGINIIDHINTAYDPGMDEKVLTTEERAGSSFDLVAETIKPTIFYKDSIIGRGEIIVGVPPNSTVKKETTRG